MCSVFNSQNRSLLIGTFWGRANVAVPCKYRDAGSAQLEEKDFAFGDDDCLLPIYGRHPLISADRPDHSRRVRHVIPLDGG
jgi:hypothetical protein